MHILKTKSFNRWAKEVKLSDPALVQAIDEMTEGSYEANLGGSVYKKRIAVAHRGKSGGVRTILAFKTHKTAIFLYGFAKNMRDNITKKEEEALKKLAKIYFSYDENQINHAIKVKELVEVLR